MSHLVLGVVWVSYFLDWIHTKMQAKSIAVLGQVAETDCLPFLIIEQEGQCQFSWEGRASAVYSDRSICHVAFFSQICLRVQDERMCVHSVLEIGSRQGTCSVNIGQY